MKKKILLTGGSGLLALNWAFSIADEFIVVLGLHKRNISVKGPATLLIDMETVAGFEAVLQNVQPDIVIHCGGLANVETCEANPELAYHVNVELSVNAANACKQQGVAFVYISTDHLFSGHTALVSEEETTAPVNEYGKTKREGEKQVLDISERFLSIRTNFYGWGSSYRNSFSDMIINNLRNNKEVTLFEDFYYTPILIEELAQTVMDLLNKNANGIYHVVGNERISKLEFGIRIAEKFELDKKLIKVSRFADRKDLVKRPADLSLSNKKASLFLNREIGNIRKNIDSLYQQDQNGFAAIMKNI